MGYGENSLHWAMYFSVHVDSRILVSPGARTCREHIASLFTQYADNSVPYQRGSRRADYPFSSEITVSRFFFFFFWIRRCSSKRVSRKRGSSLSVSHRLLRVSTSFLQFDEELKREREREILVEVLIFRSMNNCSRGLWLINETKRESINFIWN